VEIAVVPHESDCTTDFLKHLLVWWTAFRLIPKAHLNADKRSYPHKPYHMLDPPTVKKVSQGPQLARRDHCHSPPDIESSLLLYEPLVPVPLVPPSLKSLAQIEVLERRRAGRMVFYRLNTRNPIARQMKVLLNIYSLGWLLKGIRPYCRRILLFGSCAEGLDVRDSDVDLFVLTQEKEKVKVEISAHQGETGRRIAVVVVDANEFARMKREDRTLYEEIAKGIALWESD